MSKVSENLLPGGWSKYHSPTESDKQVFNEAMKGFVGVKYTPQEVSTQHVVASATNYRFKCGASIPHEDIIWEAIVEIFKPVIGNPIIMSITNI